MIKSILFFVTMSIVSPGITQSPGVTTYSNAYYGFEFDYPSTWHQLTYPGSVVLVSEPAGKELSNQATFDVAIDSVSHDVGSFCTSYESSIRTGEVFSDFKILSKQDTMFCGVPAIEYHCTATAAGLPMEWKSVVVGHRGRILKLSTASLVGFFLLKHETTDAIFQSFRLQ